MFGHTNKDTHSNIVSEFKKTHMLLYFQPPSSWEPFFLHQKNCILSMLNVGHSAHSIASITDVHTSTISRLHSKERSELHKSFGGRPTKLSPTNICYVIHLITARKAENAVWVTKSLKNITNQALSPTTVWHHLKKAGMKAVVKKKCPLLSAKHHKAHLDYAHAHKD